MIRSAYLTTGLAIKVFSKLSRANIFMHGQENIPTGPCIFVMNHFTRIETLLLPYYIYRLTQKPVMSLAAASLFRGGLEKFFDMVGVISTDDPKRDESIVRNLLTGEADWIIFPEGSMVKTKKIVQGGRYMVTDPRGMHEPHTGAAALALRAELYRTHLLRTARTAPERLRQMLDALGVEVLEEIETLSTNIVPVNLTYYPIRAAENIALDIASKLVKDMSERMVEEIMTEGTMLLSGVDLDIRFGPPIRMTDHLQKQWLDEDMARDGIGGYAVAPQLKEKMRGTAHRLMQRYMHDIYSMTTINHEHLMAAFLRKYPLKKIREDELKRRIYLASSLVTGKEDGRDIFFLHRSLHENQAHLLTDDRFGKYANFYKLAEDKGILRKDGEYLVCDRCQLTGPLSIHRGRIDNPLEVMANEVEPLKKLSRLLWFLAWLPSLLVKAALVRYLLQDDRKRFAEDCRKFGRAGDGSYLLPGLRRRIGVVLVHSYLAEPAEVHQLARYLRRQGMWVFAPRLPGHGTSAEDLATRKHREWAEAVESGYVLMSTLCDRVVLGGIAFGASLVLDLAARLGTADTLAGVFAVSPPLALRSYSTRIMPATDVWSRLVKKMKREEKNIDFLDFPASSFQGNYARNPVSGVREIGELLDSLEGRYGAIRKPALVLQADKNPVVDPRGSQQLFTAIGSTDKEYCLLSDDRHILVKGEGAGRVFARIGSFIGNL